MTPSDLLIHEATRQVCQTLVADLAPTAPAWNQNGGYLEGWCGIASAMVTVRLRRAGIRAFMVEGVRPGNGHIWVAVSGRSKFVVDPTVGQYPDRGFSDLWWVGSPLSNIHGPGVWKVAPGGMTGQKNKPHKGLEEENT